MPAYVPPSYANTIAPVPPPRNLDERARLRRAVVERLHNNPRTGCWFEGVTAAVAFQEREGHLVVPRFHVENGHELGGFIHNIRSRYLCTGRPSKDKLDGEQVWMMEALGMVWRVNDMRFVDVYIPAFTSFARREGHLRVPREHREHGIKLGHVTHNIRKQVRSGKYPQWRIDVLDVLGFEWQVLKPRAAVASRRAAREPHCEGTRALTEMRAGCAPSPDKEDRACLAGR
ncbi:helicase associated domain-containing protein [Micromonospora sp. NPDC051141]|uniref:helicase associated domain-containing protein n=1 Tax=Micromonospora sp. NPDC051141 TaxID=3364284 RepID=UPI00378A66B6